MRNIFIADSAALPGKRNIVMMIQAKFDELTDTIINSLEPDHKVYAVKEDLDWFKVDLQYMFPSVVIYDTLSVPIHRSSLSEPIERERERIGYLRAFCLDELRKAEAHIIFLADANIADILWEEITEREGFTQFDRPISPRQVLDDVYQWTRE